MPTSFTITGTISPVWAGAGARMTLGEMGDVFADSNGNYTFNNVPNGTFTVIPSKAGFSFSPTGHPVTINGANATGINFTAVTSGLWSSSFDLGLVAVNMVMLHTGKVLMYSGSFTTSAQERVWDPVDRPFTFVPNPYYNLFCSGHSQLADGRILVVGGYRPPTPRRREREHFRSGDADVVGAAGHGVSALVPDVDDACRTAVPDHVRRADVPDLPCRRARDLRSGHEPVHGPDPARRLGIPYYPFMFVLPDGTIVNAGANEDPAATSTLDLTTGTWTTVDPNVKDGHSAAMYEPGKILKSGTAADSGTVGVAAATTYVLDMTQPAPSWRPVASMAFPRAYHNMTLLPDGNVLVTGGGTALDGYDTSKAVFEAELWSPDHGDLARRWRGSAIPRLYHGDRAAAARRARAGGRKRE